MSIAHDHLRAMKDPDASALGFIDRALEPLRYDEQEPDPFEATGMILDMIPPGSRVLDVGCGTGSISFLIRDIRRCTVIGVEPHAERARKARSRGIDVAASELNSNSAFTLGRFDVVLFADVLEHMADPLSTLRLSRDLLKARGCLIASIPNVAHWTVRLNLLRGRFDYDVSGIMDATHLRWFTVRSLDRLFTQAGYRIVESKASAGLWMEEYRLSPWRWIPRPVLAKFVHGAAQAWPTLFGCQYVIRAELQP
jgi:methionine biosynthesis protein MetW